MPTTAVAAEPRGTETLASLAGASAAARCPDAERTVWKLPTVPTEKADDTADARRDLSPLYALAPPPPAAPERCMDEGTARKLVSGTADAKDERRDAAGGCSDRLRSERNSGGGLFAGWDAERERARGSASRDVLAVVMGMRLDAAGDRPGGMPRSAVEPEPPKPPPQLVNGTASWSALPPLPMVLGVRRAAAKATTSIPSGLVTMTGARGVPSSSVAVPGKRPLAAPVDPRRDEAVLRMAVAAEATAGAPRAASAREPKEAFRTRAEGAVEGTVEGRESAMDGRRDCCRDGTTDGAAEAPPAEAGRVGAGAEVTEAAGVGRRDGMRSWSRSCTDGATAVAESWGPTVDGRRDCDGADACCDGAALRGETAASHPSAEADRGWLERNTCGTMTPPSDRAEPSRETRGSSWTAPATDAGGGTYQRPAPLSARESAPLSARERAPLWALDLAPDGAALAAAPWSPSALS